MNNLNVTAFGTSLEEESETDAEAVEVSIEELALNGKNAPLFPQVYPNRARKYGYSVLIVYSPSKNNVWQNKNSVRALYARGFYQ